MPAAASTRRVATFPEVQLFFPTFVRQQAEGFAASLGIEAVFYMELGGPDPRPSMRGELIDTHRDLVTPFEIVPDVRFGARMEVPGPWVPLPDDKGRWHSAEEVTAALDRQSNELGYGDYAQAILELGPSDTAWNPASTKSEIFGPARVVYVRHADGGIDVSVTDGGERL